MRCGGWGDKEEGRKACQYEGREGNKWRGMEKGMREEKEEEERMKEETLRR